MAATIAIVGAGLSGNLLAVMLARLQCRVTVYEKGSAAADRPQGGRSINLALAARGIRALEAAGCFDSIKPLLLPLGGRIVHESDSHTRFLAYGQRPGERIWSVSRAGLNRRLQSIAQDQFGVDYRFEHECVGFDATNVTAIVRSEDGESAIEAELLVAADGAGSVIRRSLAASGSLTATETLLDHGYKELTIPPRPGGEFALDPSGLHIWPRGGFMLIALPNPDRTFTATLFLPHRGRPGFDTLNSDNIAAFFGAQFADAGPLMPALAEEFAARPVGELGTIDCNPWHLGAADSDRRVLLIGDAAHAIVPFHGQGMNAAFEDCFELARLVEQEGDTWDELIARFESNRQENARAIAAMALENYAEMRDVVRDPAFERRAALGFELERRLGDRFIPRYSMVMFHPEIAYTEAARRGKLQAEILDQAMRLSDDEAALELAAQLVEQRL